MPAFVVEGSVRWVETDAGGLIHNSWAGCWAEAAEHEMYRTLAPMVPATRVPRRHVEATFHRPLRFQDHYAVELWVHRLGRTSVTYAWQVTSGGRTCIEGQHVVVHVDDTGTSSPWPDGFAAAVADVRGPAVGHEGRSGPR